VKRKNRIGSVNESSLHETLKNLYASGGLPTESALEGYIVDIAAEGRVVEIQTGGFPGIREKITSLLRAHEVKVVYPLAVEKTIVVTDPRTGVTLYRRKSPKKGELIDMAGALLHVPGCCLHPRFRLEVLLTREEEVRAADGKGSWRRRGMRILDRRLLGIVGRVEFGRPADYARLLPEALPPSFTNGEMARIMGKPLEKIRRLTYLLRKLGILEEAGRKGNARVFRVAARAPARAPRRGGKKKKRPGRNPRGAR
jgi:hypothetical protein